ncbi:hypothetical protein I6M38_11365 [Shewanella algae]|uniref:hypothetical protein n=1 Tax=Shewanella algae TaxID=38313 RepID=UPI001AAC867C|nr:hypothetical protein [Shewanella algae]MBO2552577.1 hypothetical protein [Shewanella algae]MBO2578118.1 hypothetical protein [Shewanella algae]MBO2582470.1 hypothetical protein [Shewanella algae]
MDLRLSEALALSLSILALFSCGEAEKPPAGEPTAAQAFLYCKEITSHEMDVGRWLKFGNYSSTNIASEQFVSPINNKVYTTFYTNGYVDTTDSLGIPRRYNYECHVTRADGEHWKIDYLNVYYSEFSK